MPEISKDLLKRWREENMSEDFNTINKPQHYADKEIEVIDYIRDTLTEDQYEGYCIGNVIKYVSRYRLKGGVEDLKKARYYLEAAIQTYKRVVK